MSTAWLIYNENEVSKNKFFIERLINCALVKGVKMSLVGKASLSIRIEQNVGVLVLDGEVQIYPSFVINRTRDSFLAFCLEMIGIKVFNQSVVTEICNDKARTHAFCVGNNIKTCDTLFIDDYQSHFSMKLPSFPVVVKSVAGHGGREVYLVKDEGEMTQLMSKMTGKKLIQPLCGKFGKDVRVYTLGHQIVASFLRESNSSDFRSNYSLGGSARPYPLSESEVVTVLSVLEALQPTGLLGVDFFINEDGLLILNEIEDVVGARMLYENSSIDICDKYIRFIWEDVYGEK